MSEPGMVEPRERDSGDVQGPSLGALVFALIVLAAAVSAFAHLTQLG